MVAWTRAMLNEDPIANDEAGRKDVTKPEPDHKLEDAVRRAMNDLEQEKTAPGDTGRSRPSAA
jgi:hypothetical protein